MIANVDKVVDWLRANKIEHWQVLLKEADNSKVFESDDSGFDSNVKRFRDVMDLSSGSRFFLKAFEKKGINRGNFCEEFKNISDSNLTASVGSTPIVQGISQDEVDRKVEAALNGFKTTLRMEALEAENKELKNLCKEHDNMTTRVLGKIEPYIGTLISGAISKFMPASAPIAMAGIEYEPHIVEVMDHDPETLNTERGTDDIDQQRLEIALTKWQQADPDFISLIEAVAEMAASGDQMYGTAKFMLVKK